MADSAFGGTAVWDSLRCDRIDEVVGPFGPKLGEGAFGHVYWAKRTEDSEPCAVKVLPKAKSSKVFVDNVRCEIAALQHLSSSCVARLLDAFQSPSSVFLVIELADGGDLFDFIAQRRPSEREVRPLAQQLMAAVAYIHTMGVIHRDLKPENILLNRASRELKLCDFGLSVLCSEGDELEHRVVGSFRYMAPESLRHLLDRSVRRVGCADLRRADAFSVGAILYVMLSGAFPFPSRAPTSALFNAIQRGPTFGPRFEHVSAPAQSLMSSLLRHSLADRPTPAEALCDAWLEVPDGESDAWLDDATEANRSQCG